MTRRLYVWRDGKFLECDLNAPPQEPKAPYFWNKNYQEPRVCEASGNVYTCKGAHQRDLKAQGCFLAPPGEGISQRKKLCRKERLEDIKKAYEVAKSGFAPLTDEEKYVCKTNDEALKRKYNP